MLDDLSRALSSALSMDDIADVIVDHGAAALAAGSAALFLVEPDGLRMYRSAGYPADARERFAVIPIAPTSPVGDAVASARPVYVESRDDYAARYPESERRTRAYAQPHALSFACLPLAVEGETLGALVTMFPHARAIHHEERRVLEGLAAHAGHALVRARRFRHSEEARRRAEADRAELAILYRLLDGVARAATPDEAYEVALDAIRDAVRVERAAILLCDEHGAMRFVAWRGLSDGYRAAVEGHSPWASDDPAPHAIFVDDCEREASLAALAPVLRGEGIRSVGFVPLVHGGQLIGKFMVYGGEARAYDARDRRLARAVAEHIAVAVGRLRTEARAREQAAALARTVHFSDLFMGMVSHDLRNPLSAIANSAELLRMSGGDAVRVGERIARSTGRMSRMIDQLLDVTRIRFGQGLPLQAFDGELTAIVAPLIEESRTAHPSTTIEYVAHGDTHGAWDADRLAQLCSNLLGNAVEHGTLGHPIRVELDGRAADQVVLTVANHGAIPTELLPQLFEPFRQGRRKGAKASGLGLGLYIGREVAAGHGGSLDVTTDEASGTCFTVRLPRTH